MNSSISSSERPDRERGSLARRVLAAMALGLVALFLSFVGASEWLLRVYVAPQDYFWRHMALFRASDTPDAAFGDSHVARSILGDERLVNLAYLSETIDQMDIKIRAYYAQRRPGRVILQADPHMLAGYREEAPLRDYGARFAAERAAPSLLALDDYYRPRLLAYWSVLLFNPQGFRPTTRFTENGAIVSDDALPAPTDARTTLAAASRVRVHAPAGAPQDSPFAATYEALARDLVEAGAELCLVGFPVSPVYRRFADAEPGFAAARDWFAEIAARHGARYRSYWSAIDDNALYQDIDHLNAEGAALFTPLVLADCFGDGANGGGEARLAEAGPRGR